MTFENIVLIVADTLRAKNLPSYGGFQETTEFLSEKKNIDNYYSNSPWTVPAHATLFTGELPSEHGATTQNTFFQSENFLVQKFNDEGFRTIGLSENGLVSSELGFSDEFDSFGDPHKLYDGAESWNRIWEKDSRYDGRREKAYNASIKYLDTILEKMYQKAPESTVFVVVGDHGELIGEYEKEGSRLMDHHFGTFKELVKVPLYLYSKGENLEIEEDGDLFDHTSLHDFLRNLSEGKTKIEGKDIVRSEYFGKSGFNEQMDIETPERYRKLFQRKSFSLIDTEFKIDFASDGRFFWETDSLTEDEQILEQKVRENLIEKGEILYQWHLEE